MKNHELEKELLKGEGLIQSGAPCEIEICGKTYKVRQISQKVAYKISCLEKEVLMLEDEAQGAITLSRAKAIEKKIYSLHSKTAAYYLLGNWALFVPFLWAITWRRLFRQTNEITFGINNAGANHRDINFFLANWQVTKARLALSTMLVGNGINQQQERMESAESMLEQDALPKKEDNK